MRLNPIQILQKIRCKKARIAVIGLGYVGLPLAYSFSKSGFSVTGIDIDKNRIASLKKDVSYIEDLPSQDLKRVISKGRLNFSLTFEPLATADVVIVCVPTPLNRVKDPDVSYIMTATLEIAARIRRGMLVVLESTTYPGTTDELILPELERSGLKAGRDFYLCFSPERIDPGNKLFKTHNIPKIVGGITPQCTVAGAALYRQVAKQVVPVSSCRTAEMAKLLENTFRIVNIGLINELAKAADVLKVNIWEAIDAAKTKPFGYMPFYPGPGIGGHCIGVDPIFLSWKARTQGTDLHFIELARRMNADMPQYIVGQAVFALNRHSGKAISRSSVMMLGVSYKKDVSDVRESPALEILMGLKRLGAKLSYHDPMVPVLHHENLRLASLPLTEHNLRKQDLVILCTNHTKIRYKKVVDHCRLIYDTRNQLKSFQSKNIVRL